MTVGVARWGHSRCGVGVTWQVWQVQKDGGIVDLWQVCHGTCLTEETAEVQGRAGWRPPFLSLCGSISALPTVVLPEKPPGEERTQCLPGRGDL